jgi:hypothetical protein
MKKLEDLIIKLGKVDRRWIFLLIGIAVLIPLFKPIGLPVRPTDSSQDTYNALEALPEGSKVLLSIEYGPSTKPEIHPMAVGVMRHLFRNNHKVYITCLWPDGLFMAREAITQVAEQEFEKIYGEDYVFLGFRPGNEAVIKGIVSNIRKMYTIDANNTLISEIPMMDGITNIYDFDFLFSASAGFPGSREWVLYAADPTGIPMATGTTSVQVNDVMPYVDTGQIKGILAGMPGAAEYEVLIGQPDLATSRMDAQSFAHLVIVAFIIFGNIAYYLERKRSKKTF